MAPRLLPGSPEAGPPAVSPVTVGAIATRPDAEDRKPEAPLTQVLPLHNPGAKF